MSCFSSEIWVMQRSKSAVNSTIRSKLLFYNWTAAAYIHTRRLYTNKPFNLRGRELIRGQGP